VAALLAEVCDVRFAGFRDAQALQCQEANERVVARPGGPGDVEEPDELAAVKPEHGGLLTDARPAHMRHRRALEYPLDDAVVIEAGKRR
jgi:hypothetical protein